MDTRYQRTGPLKKLTSERISKKLLCLLLKKYRMTGSVADHHTVLAKRKNTDEHYRFIDECTAENDELTAL